MIYVAVNYRYAAMLHVELRRLKNVSYRLSGEQFRISTDKLSGAEIWYSLWIPWRKGGEGCGRSEYCAP